MAVTDKARPYYQNMLDDLIAFYQGEGRLLSESRLFAEVCIRFGDRMLVDVCPYLDLNVGECTVGAIAIMREEHAKRLFPPKV